ncbi:TetR family transcriptional regulator [Saccharopolyspora sp. NPDC050389]|uniref:acyl-CoA-like ligand-binding transcription factor n=1 Tax=Saccharopolyspora sp. NPDC050389 TaxID=3155516 RepID=UPI003409DBA3
MTASPEPSPASGLRAKKKAKTRSEIRRQALRLFATQGYESTTVEQIAEAAEVSPSTVFRYFPTKEKLVVSDGYAPEVVEAFRAQPAELSPLRAVREAIRTAFAGLSGEEVAQRRQLQELVLTVPELWAASLGNIKQTQHVLAELVAERAGHAPEDAEVRSFTGAVFGVLLEVWLRWAENPDLNALEALDQSLAHLEAGLPL